MCARADHVAVWNSYNSAAKQLEHINGLFEKERDVQILHADVKFGSDLEKSIALPTTEVRTCGQISRARDTQ